MGSVNCNLCGADDFTVVFPKGVAQLHQIVRCKKCDLMYANPQEHVDSEVMNTGELVFDPASQYFQKQQVQLPDNLRVLKVLNSLFPNRGRLLEIGSFAGIFLDKIRSAGWDVVGLEPFKAPADYAEAQYGLKIIKGFLPNPELESSSFDAIVMLHVIEHLPDPGENVREIRRIIKPGGVLVVETPRFDSLMFKILGRRERSLSNCDGHIYFFTVPTLKALLERHGFEVFRVDLVGRTLTVDRFLYNVGVILRNGAMRKLLDNISAKLRMDKYSVHVNARDMQRLYCRAK